MGGAKGEEKPGGADDWCYQFGNKNTFDSKAPKKSPLALRMFVFAMTMLCGISICSMCMKQLGSDGWSRIVKIEVVEPPCNKSTVPPSEVQFVHYPQPITYSREECKCNPVRFFAIISSQRSGSGWFETLLNSHMNVSSNGEIFSTKERRSNISSIIKTLDKVYNLDWNSSASKNECTAAVGFKWMLNQGLVANHVDVVKYFNQRGVSAIFLFRRNLLRQLVSQLANNHDRYLKQLNGTHKAHVHTKHEARILAKYKPRLNTTSLIWQLKQVDEYTRGALENLKSTRHITIYYEDLILNRTKLFDVLDFLKVPRRKLVSRHVKIHTKPLSESIENWDEVYSIVTRFGVNLTFLDPGTPSQIEGRGRPGSSTQFQQVHVPIHHRSAHGRPPSRAQMTDHAGGSRRWSAHCRGTREPWATNFVSEWCQVLQVATCRRAAAQNRGRTGRKEMTAVAAACDVQRPATQRWGYVR